MKCSRASSSPRRPRRPRRRHRRVQLTPRGCRPRRRHHPPGASLCPNLSIQDNIFLAREERSRLGTLDRKAQREATVEVLARLEEQLDPDALVGDLRIGQQQLVEIARALLQDARVLIMDEPTSALSMAEVELLFRVIRELTAAGVAVVYISHHLEESLEIADDVAVLRDGRMVAECRAADADLAWIVRNMVGGSRGRCFPSVSRPSATVCSRYEGYRSPTLATPNASPSTPSTSTSTPARSSASTA